MNTIHFVVPSDDAKDDTGVEERKELPKTGEMS